MLKNIISSLSYRLGIIIALCEREKIMSARKFRLGSLASLIEPTLIVLSLVILKDSYPISTKYLVLVKTEVISKLRMFIGYLLKYIIRLC